MLENEPSGNAPEDATAKQQPHTTDDSTDEGTAGGQGAQTTTALTFQPSEVVFREPATITVQADKAGSAQGETEAPADDPGGEGETDDEANRRRRRRGGRGRRGRGKGTDQAADQQPEQDGDNQGGNSQDSARADEAEAPAPAESGSGRADPQPSKAKSTRGKGSARRDKDKVRGEATDTTPATAEAGEGGGPVASDEPAGDDAEGQADGSTTRRRRRRRRKGAGAEATVEPRPDDPPNTVVKVREPRRDEPAEDAGEVQSVKGSTRLEAKKQRRRDGRDVGRRRAPIITEAEFLARREAVERVMVVRERNDRTQIAVLEDGVLVEHYISTAGHASLVGNTYLGKVQNVLPSMEAAFVDIGKGRNAVLYAGEVNFDIAGLEGQPKRIESVLKPGQPVLVQATKDPLGHKGARLTSQVSLAGRYLVYVPEGAMTGISRKLPDTERSRLKGILRKIVPDNAGVIVRTAAEGASEEELRRDVARLAAQWEDIQKKLKTASPPTLLYAEPDLTIRVIRDMFNEDFSKLVVAGRSAWETISAYIEHVAPDLRDRLSLWTDQQDVFAAYRVDEQLVKALDRKVWLPSGGSVVIDRTEAMVVIDVNTGKFTGKGGNLEETVTKNNLEAAEEIVRQLRLRDLGGIIVIDFIDMVLESNRELVLRRLLECLGRDRTKHQVAEVTSLGLVQMTRKRVGQGLLEAFSEACEACNGRGVRVRMDLVEAKADGAASRDGRRRAREPVPAAVDQEVEVEPPGDEPESLLDRVDDDIEGVDEDVEIVEERPRSGRRRATAPAGSPVPVTEPPTSETAGSASDGEAAATEEKARRSRRPARGAAGATKRTETKSAAKASGKAPAKSAGKPPAKRAEKPAAAEKPAGKRVVVRTAGRADQSTDG